MLKPLLWKKPCATRGEVVVAVVLVGLVVIGLIVCAVMRGM